MFKRVILSLVLLLMLNMAQAADWPEWRGPARDGICKETGLLKSWPAEGPKILWQAPMGAGFSAVAVAAGRVFTQYQQDKAQWAVAFDEATGKELWKIQTGGEFTNYPGPRATPTVDGDKVYVLNALGDLLCLEAATGKTVWQKNILKEAGAPIMNWGMACSPLVDKDRLIVIAGKSNGSSVMALNKTNGNIVWKSLNDVAGYSSPQLVTIAAKPQYVIFTGEALVGLDQANGRELWRSPWATKFDVNSAMPVVSANKIFIGSGYGTGCALVEVNMMQATPMTKEIYRNKNMKLHFNSPVLVDGYLYGPDDMTFSCVNFGTGEKKWAAPKELLPKPSVLYADGLFYVLGQTGTLVLAKCTPEEFKKISEVKGLLAGATVWTMPVIANGRLYVRDQEKLLCLDVKAQ